MPNELLKRFSGRFIDFFITHSPADIIDPYQALLHFGVCRVGRIVQIEGIGLPFVEITSPYLDKEDIGMYVYANRNKYNEGGKVQLIEARRGKDKNIEPFKATFTSFTTGDYVTLPHEYLARPMEAETDLLSRDKLNEPGIRATLDTVMAFKK